MKTLVKILVIILALSMSIGFLVCGSLVCTLALTYFFSLSISIITIAMGFVMFLMIEGLIFAGLISNAEVGQEKC